MFRKLLLTTLITTQGAIAAPTWYNNVTLNSAAYYWDGSNDVWAITWQETIATGCPTADTQKKAAYWSNGTAGANSYTVGNLRLSPALVALTANLKVDLMLDPAVCNSNYGAIFQGLRVRQ